MLHQCYSAEDANGTSSSEMIDCEIISLMMPKWFARELYGKSGTKPEGSSCTHRPIRAWRSMRMTRLYIMLLIYDLVQFRIALLSYTICFLRKVEHQQFRVTYVL